VRKARSVLKRDKVSLNLRGSEVLALTFSRVRKESV
jgi:hypothetical protein